MSDKETHANIRESMTQIGETLPQKLYLALQQLLTEWTGKAPSRIEPLIMLKGYHRQGITATVLGLALLATSLVVSSASILTLLILPVIWLLVAASLRTAQVSFTHYASHGTLVSQRWLNETLGELWSIIGFFQPLWHYRLGHIGGHHGRLNSVFDPDATFFDNYGFEKGRRNDWYWKHLFRVVFSPRVHARLFLGRLVANVLPYCALRSVHCENRADRPSDRRIVARAAAGIAFHVTLAAGLISSGYGAIYLLGYAIPAILGYQVLAIFQNISEHQPAIVPGQSAALRGETAYTGGRYFGYEYDARRPALWFSKMLFMALPQKLLTVGPTELQSHHVHHDPLTAIYSMSDNEWPMAHYVTRRAEQEFGVEYKETWGMRDALDESFKALGGMPNA